MEVAILYSLGHLFLKFYIKGYREFPYHNSNSRSPSQGATSLTNILSWISSKILECGSAKVISLLQGRKFLYSWWMTYALSTYKLYRELEKRKKNTLIIRFDSRFLAFLAASSGSSCKWRASTRLRYCVTVLEKCSKALVANS
jgi:hypothetical protein